MRIGSMPRTTRPAAFVRCGLGGAPAGGRQFVSWIHGADFARACEWSIDHDALAGPVNVTAPEPLPFRDFLRALRAAGGARTWPVRPPAAADLVGAWRSRRGTGDRPGRAFKPASRHAR